MPKAGILEGDPYIYHFPDGNASLARLFVREMIPGVAAGRGMDDRSARASTTAGSICPKHAVRLRLSSTVVVDLARPLVADALAAGYAAARVTRLPLPREKTLT